MSCYTVLKQCRVCGSPALRYSGFGLPKMPMANRFERGGVNHTTRPVAPLTVLVCMSCGHSQLREQVNPHLLFDDYVYTTGTSASFRAHFIAYAKWLRERVGGPVPRSLEIGSNDGMLMEAMVKEGFDAFGVEPSYQLVDNCRGRNLKVSHASFDTDFARDFIRANSRVHVVTANNVLAHVENLHEVLNAAAAVLMPGGLLALEVQNLDKLFEGGLFDMVYAEHRDYHTGWSWAILFALHGFVFTEHLDVPTHGGSLRIIGRLKKSGDSPEDVHRRFFPHVDPYATLIRWELLAGHMRRTSAELKDALKSFNNVVIYGAPAKLTSLMYGLGIAEDLCFKYVIDDSPTKQYSHTPGGHLPVYSREAVNHVDLHLPKPDAVLIGAWNVADDIVPRIRELFGAKVPIIVPLPKVVVL